jgi:MFS family permease
MAVGLLVGGRLGDMFGRKRMLLAGAGGFTLASVLCAVAPSAGALIGFRALQGVLGAVMLPQAFGLIRDIFPPKEMGKAWAILGPVSGLSAVLGPIVAGLLIDADLLGTGWRMIFLVNVPIGAFVLIAGAKEIPDVAPSASDRRLDLTGIGIAAAGTLMLVFPLVQGRELGWPAWIVAMLAGAVVLLAAFGARQVRRKRAGAAVLIAGMGMGMVFVPLFDIILGGVEDHEVGSASGVLQAMQQLGMSLGLSGVGTVFFGRLGSYTTADFVGAAEVTMLVTVGLLAVAFALGFLLPAHAREPEAETGTGFAGEPVLA